MWALILHEYLVVASPASITCDRKLYGTPNIDDCFEAMDAIPYFNDPRGYSDNNEATALRTFVEPQSLKPAFSAVTNSNRKQRNAGAPLALVQLPKIWRSSMCFDPPKTFA